MSSNTNDSLKASIETQHGGIATYVETAPVKETFAGQTVWEGVVEVFDLEGNARSTRAYAWSSPIEGSDKRRFFAIHSAAPTARTKSIYMSHEEAMATAVELVKQAFPDKPVTATRAN